jgi:branched-subunit amino acid transport protein
MNSKAGKFFRVGLLVDLGLLVAAISAIVVGSLFTYDGRCGSIIMEPTHTPCNILQYVATELFVIVVVGMIFFWWLILIVLLLPPLVGYLVGRRLPV